MKNKTLETIKRHNLIEKGMHIVVGLSGGPDSVCLFDVLDTLTEELELKLYAVHINHKLRPGAAEEDQQYVEELCQKRNVPCHVYAKDCNAIAKRQGLTSEEAGRKVRYEAFSNVALELEKQGIPKDKIAIALAHNANDQCETILFRIMRGTGTDGLAGIPYKRLDENGYSIIRPILDLNRDEIEKYCHDRKLEPKIDHTNSENIYARNKIRNLLIPYLQENFNENIIETVNRLGKIASEDREYMASQSMEAYKKSLADELDNIKVTFHIDVLLSLHNAIRFRVYTIALERLGMEQNITFAQGEMIDRILVSKSPSAMCDLTDGFVVQREYDRVTFRRKVTDFDGHAESVRFDIGGVELFQGYKLTTMTRTEFDKFRQSHNESHNESNNESNNEADKKSHNGSHNEPREKSHNESHNGSHNETQNQSQAYIYGAFQGLDPRELCIRTRKPGDTINTGNGTKKIQDFFVDQKVPKHCRDNIKLLAKGSKILWVLPSEEFLTENMRQKGRFSADYRVQNCSKSNASAEKREQESQADDLVIVLEKL